MLPSNEGAVKSAERVAMLLELLAHRRTPLRLMEIAQALEIPRSSAHGLLQTLVTREFVVRDEEHRYRLGVKLFTLAATALDLGDVRDVARPSMEVLSRQLRATVNLAVLDRHDVLYIEKVEDRYSPIRLVTHVGTRLPAHATSLGKVLVAELPARERADWLERHDFEKFTERTCQDAAAFERDLAGYRAAGYAVDDQGFHDAIVGIAAPVRDYNGRTIAALSVTRLGAPMTAAALAATGTQVCATAEGISRARSQTGAAV